MTRRIKRKQLRKQPRRRRTYMASSSRYPHLNVPVTARKRRRRQKTEGVRFGLSALKRIIFSSRWISLGLLGLSIFALMIIFQEKRFYLTYIPVDGAVSYSSQEIVAASELAGNHVFSADPSQAADKIGALPGVISSTVSLKWPNQVYIAIAEEKPVAVWQENGTDYGITKSGRLVAVGFPLTGLLQIIPETGALAISAVPVAAEEVVAGAEVQTEEMPAAEEPTVAEEETAVESDINEEVTPEEENNVDVKVADSDGEGVEAEANPTYVPQEVLLGALSLRELRPSINSLYYRPTDGLSYQDERGWRVHFGTGNDMNQKLVLYETILNDLLTRGISPRYISVSNMSKPYYLAQ